MKPTVLLTVGLVFVVSAHASAADPTFERDVLPIFRAHCLSCHGGFRQKGKLDLRSLEAILKGGSSGDAIRRGNSKGSVLWQLVEADEMPEGEPKMSAKDKATLRRWIESGAAGTVHLKAAVHGDRPSSPADVAMAIDREIDRTLRESGIPASPPADDGEFLRRASLDIKGRLPSPERVLSFLDSQAPEKRSDLIAELLKDSGYGRHFGTLWHNQLVPLQVSYAVKGKRVYNEWLLEWLAESFQEGRPWNEMVEEMLGSQGNHLDHPAIGFLALNTENSDRALKTARLFLGMRLECVQCHDHPYNYRRQVDYWGLAAFFAQSRVSTPQIKRDVSGKAPVELLVVYCNFACITGCSPVGLKFTEPMVSDGLNGLLQQLAWDNVTAFPMSGVRKK